MMPRQKAGDDAPFLFDLPLEGPAREPEPAIHHETAPAPLPEPERPEKRAPRRPRGLSELPVEEFHPAPRRVGKVRGALRSRLSAGIADLVVHGALGVVAMVGARLLGARPGVDDWPAIAAFLLSFSFLYTVLPLAFWGQTLGMAWADLTSRNRDGEPLTFDQAARRWLGSLLTAGTLGLPLFVTAGRRSLTDLVSGSATYPVS